METPHIPSELLEPNVAKLLGAWWQQVEDQKRSKKSLLQMRERMLALSALASTSGAVHASIVLNKHLRSIGKLIEHA